MSTCLLTHWAFQKASEMNEPLKGISTRPERTARKKKKLFQLLHVRTQREVIENKVRIEINKCNRHI